MAPATCGAFDGYLQFYCFKIIRNPQFSCVILLPFLHIQFFSICKVLVLCVIQKKILNAKSLSFFAGVFYCQCSCRIQTVLLLMNEYQRKEFHSQLNPFFFHLIFQQKIVNYNFKRITKLSFWVYFEELSSIWNIFEVTYSLLFNADVAIKPWLRLGA